jgi:hypothetical protein
MAGERDLNSDDRLGYKRIPTILGQFLLVPRKQRLWTI